MKNVEAVKLMRERIYDCGKELLNEIQLEGYCCTCRNTQLSADQHSMAQHSAAQYNAAQIGTGKLSTGQYSTSKIAVASDKSLTSRASAADLK